MNFSKAKSLLLKPQKELLFSTFLIALCVSAAFFVPYMVMSEGYFTFYGDFNVQQIPFYQSCHEAIKNGNIFWSTTTDLGANFIGSYSFYLLGSPFFYLTLLFPNSFVPYLMGPLLILKFGCAAATAYLYIRRFTRTPEAARLGGLLYAFSGFSVYNIFFNHFHEAIIIFPLLLLSLELLITENRRGLFCLTVFASAFINYFFFFGMVVFTVIYFFVRLALGAFKINGRMFAVLVFEAVLGLLLSAVLLLPSVMAITGNSRLSEILLGWNAIMYGKEQIYGNILECFFFPPDIPARPVFFPSANVKWSSLGGWLPLFSVVGVFAMFRERKGNWASRLIGICIFMALVPILNSAFYAFNSAYYARWFYMPILIICLSTVTLTEDKTVDWDIPWSRVFLITAAVSLVFGLFPQKDSDGNLFFGLYTHGNDHEDNVMYTWRFWLACLIALVSLIMLRFIINKAATAPKTFYKAATALVCIITVLYANVFIACGRSHSYDTKKVVIDQLIEGDVKLDGNPDEYRIDVYEGVDNVSMYLGYSGINAFHSVVPQSITEFYEYIGMERTVASRPGKEYSAIRPLLSVKYLLDSKEKSSKVFYDADDDTYAMPGYAYTDTQSGYYIYENENYIPYGFSYDYYMSYDTCDRYNEGARANMMLKAMLLTDEQIEKYGYMFEDINTVDTMFSPYETTSLSFSDDALAYDCKKLAETSAKSFEADNKGFTAKVVREKDSLVFFSIPYDRGFTATVNGKKCEIEKVNVGFMAVKVGKGVSEIRFEYTTPGLKYGVLISAFALLLFLIYMTVALSRKTKSVPTANSYPEGEKLLGEWKTAILAQRLINGIPLKEAEDETEESEPSVSGTESSFDGGFTIDTSFLNDNDL